jgi:hypothetical protein
MTPDAGRGAAGKAGSRSPARSPQRVAGRPPSSADAELGATTTTKSGAVSPSRSATGDHAAEGDPHLGLQDLMVGNDITIYGR